MRGCLLKLKLLPLEGLLLLPLLHHFLLLALLLFLLLLPLLHHFLLLALLLFLLQLLLAKGLRALLLTVGRLLHLLLAKERILLCSWLHVRPSCGLLIVLKADEGSVLPL